MPRKARTNGAASDRAPPTTAQSLGSLLKSARDIMRKDKGLNGDLDRLPLLTWIMFLKFLDDLELQREEEAKLAGKKFRPAIEPPYRWRDWAANPQGITGDELLAFINQDEAIRPDGKRGAGPVRLPARPDQRQRRRPPRRDRHRLQGRRQPHDERLPAARRHQQGRRHPLHLERRDAHPRRALRVDAPRDARRRRRLRRVLHAAPRRPLHGRGHRPAAGRDRARPGLRHRRLPRRGVQPPDEAGARPSPTASVLQERSLFGCEPKPLPYLLCQMNLLLHGLDAPQIDPGNALRFKLSEIGEKDRVDVILTNPPFGGEEEKGIQGNFPEDKQTAETALLFLQLIMRKLHRQPTPAGRPARAAVVVPNGTLFGDGVCARIKEELLKEFNLHTIVRLPNGVFAPYTSIPTNLLFFDRSGPTKDVWYYEHPLPEGRKNYTKTQPIQFEEFAPAWRGGASARRTTGLEGFRSSFDRSGLQVPLTRRIRRSRGGFRTFAPGAVGGRYPGRKEVRIVAPDEGNQLTLGAKA